MDRTCLELSAAAAAASVGLLRNDVADAARRAGAARSVVDDVRLCVGEAAANAVQHAYGPDPGTIDVRVRVARDELTVVVRDEGRGFKDTDVAQSRGYGLMLMEQLPTHFAICSAPHRGTEVSMTFDLRPPAETTPV